MKGFKQISSAMLSSLILLIIFSVKYFVRTGKTL